MRVKDLIEGETYMDTVSCRPVMTFLENGIMKAKFFDEETKPEIVLTLVDNQLEELPYFEDFRRILSS